jgi:hypothetical protein
VICGDEAFQLLSLDALHCSFEDLEIFYTSEDFHISGTLTLLPSDPFFAGKVAGIFFDARCTTVA